METLDQVISVWGPFLSPTSLNQEGANHLNIALCIAFDAGWNQTRAVCVASECAIHHSTASRVLCKSDIMNDVQRCACNVILQQYSCKRNNLVSFTAVGSVHYKRFN